MIESYNVAMKNIVRLRKLRGWNQTLLAEACGVEQPTISKAERGTGGTSLKVYQAIASALEVPLYVLFQDDRSETEARLLEIFRSLPEERKKGWLDMARSVLDSPQKSDQ